MKKVLSILFATMLAGQAWAYDFKSGDLYYNITSDSTVAVTYQFDDSNNYSGLDSITIPEKVIYNEVEYAVTGIGFHAFLYCSGLTSISIPNSVTSIGYLAFYNCNNLHYDEYDNALYIGNVENPYLLLMRVKSTDITSCEINSNCKLVYQSAFEKCSCLTSVTIKSDIDFSSALLCFKKNDICFRVLNKNSVAVFSNSYSGEVVIPATVTAGNTFEVTSIGSSAFANCGGLTSVTIPSSVSYIGSSAFANCEGLTSVTIPNSVTSIDQSAFSGCSNLKTVNFNAKNCTSMGSVRYPVFENCSSLKTLNIGDNVETIPSSAFNNCRGLTSVTIPNSVTNIGNYAFYDCTGFATITIPDSVISIGESAFSGCSGLETITIPESVISIGESAFSGCSGLETVNYNAKKCTSMGSYSYSPFRYCSSLKTLNIGNNVETIPSCAFSKCSSLTSVTIGNSVKNIGSSAFNGCSGLTSVIVPNSVTEIGSAAFGGCTSLESITLPFVGDKTHTLQDTYQYPFGYIFGTGLFTGGTATTQYYYGSSTSSTTSDTYCIPSSMKSVTITGSNYLPYGAFRNCSGLKSVIIPNTVTSIGKRVFYNCSGLISVTIGNSVQDIEEQAFFGCSSLTSVSFPNSVTSIGYEAFSGCSDLALVTIPNTVKSISNYAFTGCGTICCEAKNKPSEWNWEWNGDAKVYWGLKKPKFTDDFVYNIINGTESPYQIEIYLYRGDSITANIPTSVTLDGKDYEVVSIAKDAFKGYDNLDYISFGNAYYIGNEENPYLILITAKNKRIESCEINSKCRFIYDEAFSGCTNITEISIPGSVIGIGYNAFSGAGLQKSKFASIGQICGIRFANNYSNPLALTRRIYIDTTEVLNLVVPDSVISIGDYAFYNCSNLSTATIGNTIENIGQYAFYDCTGLTSISIPESVKCIGISAFGCKGSYGYRNGIYDYYYNTNLQKAEFGSIESLCRIKFSNSNANPLSIARQLYVGGEKVVNLVIPVTIGDIGSYAFCNCASLASVVISDSVKSIGNYAFSRCNRLASVVIHNSVTSIGTEAFNGCSSIKSLSYNSNAIGAHFNNISALQSIFIGDSIKNISGSEFSGCDNLVNVISMAAVPPTLNGDPYTYADTIYVPAASVEAYKAAPVWKRKEILPLDYYSIQAKADTARGTVSGTGNFAAKQAVTIYATPAENYHFKAWSDGNTENPRTMLVNADLNVTAIFEGDECTVNVSANSLAFGSVVGAESYHYGDTVTFTATPVVGYHFVGWSDSVTTNPRVWIVTEDSSFNAVFEINKYAIAASADANGTVVGDSTYNHGTTATLTATANVGYHFVMWNDRVTTNPRNVVATGDSAFTAVFAIDTHTITATAENGSVTGTDTYDYGTEATITATPAEGYHFVKWSDGNTNATRTIVVTDDLLLNAVFAINTYAITAVAAANGTVTGGNTYNHGTNVSLKAIANEGYHFVMWNDSVTANPRNVVATGDSVFTAVFAIDTHTLTITAENDSVTGADTYDYGTEVTITATPAEGYHFVKWSDGNTEATRTIIVTEDLQLTAIFEKNEEQGGNENQGGNNEGNENQGGENTNPGTAVAESAANAISIYAHGNTIVVENATDEIRVYNAMGALVGRDVACRVRAEINVNGAGVYIVKVGTVAKRVMIND